MEVLLISLPRIDSLGSVTDTRFAKEDLPRKRFKTDRFHQKFWYAKGDLPQYIFDYLNLYKYIDRYINDSRGNQKSSF